MYRSQQINKETMGKQEARGIDTVACAAGREAGPAFFCDEEVTSDS